MIFEKGARFEFRLAYSQNASDFYSSSQILRVAFSRVAFSRRQNVKNWNKHEQLCFVVNV